MESTWVRSKYIQFLGAIFYIIYVVLLFDYFIAISTYGSLVALLVMVFFPINMIWIIIYYSIQADVEDKKSKNYARLLIFCRGVLFLGTNLFFSMGWIGGNGGFIGNLSFLLYSFVVTIITLTVDMRMFRERQS